MVRVMNNPGDSGRTGSGHSPGVGAAGAGDGELFPEPSAWLEVWRKASEQARRRTPEVRMDMTYGKGPGERLDLYLPGHRPRKLPFAAFVPGVGWRGTARADSAFPARAIHHHGAALVVIGFDPLPAVDLARQVDQVGRAWRFLVNNADRLGLDAIRGHLMGHGSGAHLAALAAFDPQAPPAASAVLLSGVYDLTPGRLSRLREQLGLDLEEALRFSPMRCLSHEGPAVVVTWGDAEPEELRRQSESFARACKARGLRVIQGALPGRGHFDLSLELANPHSPVLATLRDRDARRPGLLSVR